MTAKPIRIGLIYGSTREGRFCDTVADWAYDRITHHGSFAVDCIDPKAFAPFGGNGVDGAATGLRRRVELADAFVVVTPEYNHGYPAPLKALIDAAYREWQAKPVGFVSYGGASGGLRAVEQLRLVFAELHAVTLRNTVSLANPWNRFDGAGRLIEPQQPTRAMATMLAYLEWWATALSSARNAAPYEQVAA